MKNNERVELYREWRDGKIHYRRRKPKADNPPMPDSHTLLDLSVKHVLDVNGEPLCKVPEGAEKFMNSRATCVISCWAFNSSPEAYEGRRWIVEDDEYAAAKAAWRDEELQLVGLDDEWNDWDNDSEPLWNWPPSHYRRKPRGQWVECKVEEDDNEYYFTAPEGVILLLTDAPSVKGFGGYFTSGRWNMKLQAENNPPSNGAVIVKPNKVRFWREG